MGVIVPCGSTAIAKLITTSADKFEHNSKSVINRAPKKKRKMVTLF
jgi:hypothetical protein